MALQKQPLSLNFSQGLDLKTDPYQVQPGKFLSLSNMVFTTGSRLTKRNGYQELTALPVTTQTTLTTLNDNLLATGSNIYAYNSDLGQWFNKGIVQPVTLSTLPLVRVSTSQTSPDTAIAPNGLALLAYIDNSQAYYQISDSKTGEQIISRTALPASAVSPRTFVLGNYFIVMFLDTVSASTHIQYIFIPLNNPASPSVVTNFASDASSLSAGWDGLVFAGNETLYVAYGATSTSVKIRYLTRSLGAGSAATSIASSSASLMSVTSASNTIVISWWDTTNIYAASFNTTLTAQMAKTTLVSSVTINELTSTASSNLSIFYQVTNNYSYTSPPLQHNANTIRSDYISTQTCTLPASGTGSPGSATVILRSVGLASKAFISSSGTIYMLATYGDTKQLGLVDDSNEPTYFLIDGAGNIYMRLAYSNGGGYAQNQVLPSISLSNNQYYVAYLNNDFIAAVNKGTNLTTGTQINGIYTQTGVNLATFSINDSIQHSSEIASALHLTGGQLWEYDGVLPVEHSFHVWPENVQIGANPSAGGGLVAGTTYFYQFTYEWTDNAGNLHRSAPSIPASFTPITAPASFTGNATSGSPILTHVSSLSGLQIGQQLTGTDIPVGAYITSFFFNSIGGYNEVIMSGNATGGSNTTVTVSVATITVIDINVPTLRLTYKNYPQIASDDLAANNPVRIVGYRWSSTQQVYYQFTSLTSPTLSDVTVDSVTFTDSVSDASILGNNIIYTTGSVIENIAAPASIDSALFNNRLWLIDAEDQNLLWYSKQVIENTPVEMSDLLTLYVAPSTGVQGSTGPMTALSAMDDKLIIFKNNAIYYINGVGPDNTGANSAYSDAVYITSAVGSTNPNSIVLMPNGLMFQSDKGIWLLGRDLSTNYIGAAVESYNSQPVLSADVIPGTTQVRFILSSGTTLMYDYFYQQWATHTNIAAISSTVWQGAHTYMNTYGQIFQETPNMYLDGSNPVLMGFTTSWINLAGLQGFERFYFGNLLGTYFTPFVLNVGLAYNYNPSAVQSILVTPDNYTQPWGGEASWGSGGSWGSDQVGYSGSQANVFSARLWPDLQKCQSFQVSVQEVYDSSFGATAGEGLTLSGLALIVGMKKGYRTQSASKSFGS